MSRHTMLLRAVGAAALTLAGITVSTGAAHAATAVSCGVGLTAGPAVNANLGKCGSFTDSGAPYTVFLGEYVLANISGFGNPGVGGILYNVTITCQGVAPNESAGAGYYYATNCTDPF